MMKTMFGFAWAAAGALSAVSATANRARRLEKRMALAAVGRNLIDYLAALDQVQRVEALTELPGLGVAQVDVVADPQRARRGALDRRLYLAGALESVERQAGRQIGLRQPVLASGAGRDVAAAEQRHRVLAGAAHDRQREHRRRRLLERGVAVEQRRGVETGARCYLSDGILGGGGVQASGTAAVDQPDWDNLVHRGDDRSPPLGDLGRRRPLQCADRRALKRLAERPVADAGDVALVAHQS